MNLVTVEILLWLILFHIKRIQSSSQNWAVRDMNKGKLSSFFLAYEGSLNITKPFFVAGGLFFGWQDFLLTAMKSN